MEALDEIATECTFITAYQSPDSSKPAFFSTFLFLVFWIKGQSNSNLYVLFLLLLAHIQHISL